MNPTKERVLNNVIRSNAAREGAKAVRGRNKGEVTQSFKERYSHVLRKARNKKVIKELRKNTKIIHKLRSKHPVDEMTRQELSDLILETVHRRSAQSIRDKLYPPDYADRKGGDFPIRRLTQKSWQDPMRNPIHAWIIGKEGTTREHLAAKDARRYAREGQPGSYVRFRKRTYNDMKIDRPQKKRRKK